MNCSETVTVEIIYTIVPQTYTIYGGIYENSFSASRRLCWSVRERCFPGNAVHKTELSSQTLLHQTLAVSEMNCMSGLISDTLYER